MQPDDEDLGPADPIDWNEAFDPETWDAHDDTWELGPGHSCGPGHFDPADDFPPTPMEALTIFDRLGLTRGEFPASPGLN